jgi:hypothetical protein
MVLPLSALESVISDIEVTVFEVTVFWVGVLETEGLTDRTEGETLGEELGKELGEELAMGAGEFTGTFGLQAKHKADRNNVEIMILKWGKELFI